MGVIRRTNFKDCEIFTSNRSLHSINESLEDRLGYFSKEVRILDAFSGAGIVGESVSNYLSKCGVNNSIVSVDINPLALSQQTKSIAEKKVADLRYNTDLGMFDIIVIRYGLHDLSLSDKEKTITSLVLMLNTGGLFVLSDIMPEKATQNELTYHHQKKENLCMGANKEVYLATSNEYIELLQSVGLDAKVTDVFMQEVYLRNWLSTLGVSNNVLVTYDKFTLSLSKDFQKEYQVFSHPKKGVKMYYPIKTLLGIKNG